MFESCCERDHLIALDFDPKVAAVAAQPLACRWRRLTAVSRSMYRISWFAWMIRFRTGSRTRGKVVCETCSPGRMGGPTPVRNITVMKRLGAPPLSEVVTLPISGLDSHRDASVRPDMLSRNKHTGQGSTRGAQFRESCASRCSRRYQA